VDIEEKLSGLGAGSLPHDLQDLVGLGVAARRFLRVDEVAVEYDLEDPSARGNDCDVRDRVLKLFQQAFRQTDGSRCVSSLSAVFDG
jgi:hypothetical protein